MIDKLNELYDKMTELTEGESTYSPVNIYCNTWGNYNENGANADSIDGGWKSLDDAVEWWNKMAEQGEEPFVNDVEINEDIPFEIGEDTNLPEVAEQINDFMNLDEDEKEIILAIMEADSEDYSEAKQRYEDGRYIYYNATNEYDLAQEVIDSFGSFKEAVGDNLSYYLDEDEISNAIYDDEKNYFYEDHSDEYTDENGDLDEDAFDEAFEDWFETEMENIMDDPETYLGDNLKDYFDYEAFGNDLSYDYTITDHGSIMLD